MATEAATGEGLSAGEGLSVGVLGDHRSFAGQAFSVLARNRPEWQPSYGRSLAELWTRLDAGGIDALLTTAETGRQGPQEGYRRILEGPPGARFVAGEATVPYRCQLLGKPGAQVSGLRRVVGHGSLAECHDQLDRLAPGAELIVTSMSSVHAADEVLHGDGTTAVIGTHTLGEELGLAVLAQDVDGGSDGVWWLITTAPLAAERPDRLVIRLPIGPDRTALARVVVTAEQFGWHVRTVFSRPSQEGIFNWQSLVVLTGDTGDPDLLPALSVEPDVDVVGAFRATSGGRPVEETGDPSSRSSVKQGAWSA